MPAQLTAPYWTSPWRTWGRSWSARRPTCWPATGRTVPAPPLPARSVQDSLWIEMWKSVVRDIFRPHREDTIQLHFTAHTSKAKWVHWPEKTSTWPKEPCTLWNILFKVKSECRFFFSFAWGDMKDVFLQVCTGWQCKQRIYQLWYYQLKTPTVTLRHTLLRQHVAAGLTYNRAAISLINYGTKMQFSSASQIKYKFYKCF